VPPDYPIRTDPRYRAIVTSRDITAARVTREAHEARQRAREEAWEELRRLHFLITALPDALPAAFPDDWWSAKWLVDWLGADNDSSLSERRTTLQRVGERVYRYTEPEFALGDWQLAMEIELRPPDSRWTVLTAAYEEATGEEGVLPERYWPYDEDAAWLLRFLYRGSPREFDLRLAGMKAIARRAFRESGRYRKPSLSLGAWRWAIKREILRRKRAELPRREAATDSPGRST
jgi:hypothetical protein